MFSQKLMESTLLSSFCMKLKREAFKEKLLANHCVMTIDKWIDCVNEQVEAYNNKIIADLDEKIDNHRIMRLKIFNQIHDIFKTQRRRILLDYTVIGIDALCKIIMNYAKNLEDGWAEKYTCENVIHILVESLKFTIIRDISIPALVTGIEMKARNQGIFDPSIVIDCENWLNKIRTVVEYRSTAYPDEGNDYLIDAYALSDDERTVLNRKVFNIQFMDFLRDVRNDYIVGPLISFPKLIEIFNDTGSSKAYTCGFIPWSKEIIIYAYNLLIETFKIALMETNWSDILLAKFMDPDEYSDVCFRKWHETMFDILNPSILLHVLYPDVLEEEREEKHETERTKFIEDEEMRYMNYEIERIHGEFAKLSDQNGQIIKLKKY